MIGKFKNILKKDVLSVKLPKHIAITMDGIENWALKNGVSLEDALKKSFLNLKSTMRNQVKLNIPILSFYVMNENEEMYSYYLDAIVDILNDLANSGIVNENKIKISVLGKWYRLPGRVVDATKKAIEGTKDYDNFFVNLYINYDGQEEIVDALKLIGMQIKAGRIDPDLLDKQTVKDNIYSSYFLPPELLIKNGSNKGTSGFLLWDSANTKIYFTNKLWPDFDKAEFHDAIRDYQKGR